MSKRKMETQEFMGEENVGSVDKVDKVRMSMWRKIIITLFIITTVLCFGFAYQMFFQAKKMWDLGDVNDLSNMPCTVERVILASHEAVVTNLNNEELRVELGPLDQDIKIGDSIGVVYKNGEPITSFNKYYQTIQIALLSMLIAALSLVVTICFMIISAIDLRDKNKEGYYLDDDYLDDEFLDDDYLEFEKEEDYTPFLEEKPQNKLRVS